MPDSGSKPVSSLFNSRALIYNNSLKDGHEFGAVRQYIASIALKIQEGLVLDPKLAANLTPEEREKTVVDQSWALTRLIFTNQSSGNVLRDIAQQAGLIGGGLLNPIRYQNFPSEAILEYAKQVIDDLINLNQLLFQSLERTLIDLLSSNQQNKLLLTSYSQGTIWTPILLDSPNIKTYEPPSKKGCIISTFQIANMTTPYSFYEGDPLYVTSNRDNIVNAVRQGISTISSPDFLNGYVPPPADSNFTGDVSRATNGHGLSQVYLNGRRGGRPTNNSGRAISGRKIISPSLASPMVSLTPQKGKRMKKASSPPKPPSSTWTGPSRENGSTCKLMRGPNTKLRMHKVGPSGIPLLPQTANS